MLLAIIAVMKSRGGGGGGGGEFDKYKDEPFVMLQGYSLLASTHISTHITNKNINT